MTVPIKTLTPTPLLRREGSRLLQTAKLELHCSQALPEVSACIIASSRDRSTTALTAAEGKTVVDIDVPEVRQPCELVCELRQGETVLDRKTIPWQPPRRWTVHVVQLSHHDVGYTDLASHVIQEHDRSLDAIIEMAAATRDFPEDARFSAVIEQAWSIDHFLNHAPPERHAAMIDLLRRGDLEVTALFGNLTTELCGHELLARSVYHAFRLKRKHGIPIVSAENNDIPGFTWGLCQVLTEAGIRMFCPGLPKYYNWGKTEDVPSFWDETAIFGKTNMPGAFWWEAPNGKRILFWSNNSGCGGSCDPSLPGLPERLQTLEQNDYPYSVLRWPVIGAGRDNSPYIEDYAHTIRAWNERWVSPRLVSSTNARFYEGILPQLPKTLPVFRGDVPGQDYPVGAASTAEATAVNRRNHSNLQSAEILASAASELTDYTYQADRLFNACEETLWHDEHTWGHHFPAGPTACASELEKAVHAHRAAALAHDVSNKAMARIADAIHLDTSDIHLVVFNPLPHQRSGPVTAPLRELDNCGSTMMRTEKGTLRGALLHDRWHVNPPLEIVEGNFDLVDVDTGEEVPYQLQDIDSPLGPQLYAAQRLGLGSGGKRYGGLFENPRGVKRDILFHAEHVPALGYRIYRLRPGNDQPEFPVQVSADKHTLENDFYRLELTPDTGFVRSLVDMESGREVIANNASHPFGAIVVRTPRGADETCMFKGIESVAAGPLAATLRAVFAACGHPRIEVTYTLHAREKRVDVAIGMVKDPTPLLETYAVFPFALPH
ncbi:MAG: hypothetical protein K9N51_07615, partial [Candidatus Pacebacteria bacterium]|nr:hypothetical protein [Candidatus Paceibacterota bacterium]